MPSVSKTMTFQAPIQKVFDVIKDFESYPDFVDGVDGIKILEQTDSSIRAEYSLNLIKEFTYIIDVTLEAPSSVSWEFHSGDLFKKNDGGWSLKEISETETEVTYELDVAFKMLAPKMIVNKLVKTNLPLMMNAFKKRVES